MRRYQSPIAVTHWMATILCLLLVAAWPVRAQEAIEVLTNEHEHVFRESMTFRLHAKAASS